MSPSVASPPAEGLPFADHALLDPNVDASTAPTEEGERRNAHAGSILWPPPDSTHRKVTFSGAVRMLIASTMGGTTLSLPFAFERCGLVVGAILLALFAVMLDCSLNLIVLCSRRTGKVEYYDIARHLFGPRAQKFVACLTLLAVFLNTVAFVILIGDVAVPLAEHFIPSLKCNECGGTGTSIYVWFKIGGVILVAPLCFLRTLHSLRFLNYVTTSSAFILILVVTWRSIETLNVPHWVAVMSGGTMHKVLAPGSQFSRWLPNSPWDVIQAAPILVTAFMCHTQVLRLHAEFNNPTRSRFRGVIHASLCYGACMYCIVGVFGYMYASEHTCGNILLNFPTTDPLAVSVRFLMLLIVLGNIPMQVLPGRKAFFYVLKHSPTLTNSLLNTPLLSRGPWRRREELSPLSPLPSTAHSPRAACPVSAGQSTTYATPPVSSHDAPLSAGCPPDSRSASQRRHFSGSRLHGPSARGTTAALGESGYSTLAASDRHTSLAGGSLLTSGGPSSTLRRSATGAEEQPAVSGGSMRRSVGPVDGSSSGLAAGFLAKGNSAPQVISPHSPSEPRLSLPQQDPSHQASLCYSTSSVDAESSATHLSHLSPFLALHSPPHHTHSHHASLGPPGPSASGSPTSAAESGRAPPTLLPPPSSQGSVHVHPAHQFPPRTQAPQEGLSFLSLAHDPRASMHMTLHAQHPPDVPGAVRVSMPSVDEIGPGEPRSAGRPDVLEADPFHAMPQGMSREEMEAEAVDPSLRAPKWAFVSFTLTFIALATLTATVMENIVTIWSFGGAAVSTTFAFTLPGLMYLKISHGTPWRKWRLVALALVCCAIPVSLAGISKAVTSLNRPSCPAPPADAIKLEIPAPPMFEN